MKTIIKIIILLIPITGIGQAEIDSNAIYNSDGVIGLGTISEGSLFPGESIRLVKVYNDRLCYQRGHEMPDVLMATSAYCPPYIIDTDTTSIKVYPGCNEYRYECMRCGAIITEKEKERRVVIWRKE